VAGLRVKAEPSASGSIRGNRHVMSDDSDINGSRHARALVGGVLAGRLGDTRLFVSGGPSTKVRMAAARWLIVRT